MSSAPLFWIIDSRSFMLVIFLKIVQFKCIEFESLVILAGFLCLLDQIQYIPIKPH